jgi:hypothetical protein
METTGQTDGREREIPPDDRDAAETRDEQPVDDAEERPTHLLVVDYQSQPERKRAEYRLDKFDGEVEKLSGLVRVVRGRGFVDLYEEIRSSADDPDHVDGYELDPVSRGSEEYTDRLSRTYGVERERVEWAMESLLKKRRTVKRTDTEYRVETDHGSVELRYEVDGDDPRGTELTVWLTGTGTAPKALEEFVVEELGYMLPEAVE